MALKNVYSINVDIKRRMTSVVPTFKQGDEATLKFRVYDNGVLLDLTNDIYSEITFTLPNGETLLGYPELVNGELVYDFTGIEMIRPGKVLTILSIRRSNTMVSVPPFNCFIFDSMRGETLSYIGILQDLIKETQDLGLNFEDITDRLTQILELADGELEELQRAVQTATSDVATWRTDEQQRRSSEQQRVNSETTRASNEQSRVNAESNRAVAENSRTQAESNRTTTFNNQMQQTNTKINEMNVLIENLESFDYSSSTTYDFPNLITYNGSTYMALKQVRGITPTNDKINYRLVAQRGVDGTGSVSKVNGISPDLNGNVVIDVGDSEELNMHKNNTSPQKHINVVSSIPNDISNMGILVKVDGSSSDVPAMTTVDELNDKLNSVAVTVKTTDSTNVIISKLTNADGNSVKFPTGEYVLNGANVPSKKITITKPIKISGDNAVVYLESGIQIELKSPDIEISGIDFRVRNHGTLVGAEAILVIRRNNIKLDRCKFSGTQFYYGILIEDNELKNCDDVSITNCKFDSLGYGVLKQYGQGCSAHRLVIEDCTITNTLKGDAIELNIGEDVGYRINNNYIDGVFDGGIVNAGIGIGIAGGRYGGDPLEQTREGYVLNNIVKNTDRCAIHLEACNRFDIKGNKVTNDGRGIGIETYGCTDLVIDSNYVENFHLGILDDLGVYDSAYIVSTDNNFITNNNVSLCDKGIELGVVGEARTQYCISNTVKNCDEGIVVYAKAIIDISENLVEDCEVPFLFEYEPTPKASLFPKKYRYIKFTNNKTKFSGLLADNLKNYANITAYDRMEFEGNNFVLGNFTRKPETFVEPNVPLYFVKGDVVLTVENGEVVSETTAVTNGFRTYEHEYNDDFYYQAIAGNDYIRIVYPTSPDVMFRLGQVIKLSGAGEGGSDLITMIKDFYIESSEYRVRITDSISTSVTQSTAFDVIERAQFVEKETTGLEPINNQLEAIRNQLDDTVGKNSTDFENWIDLAEYVWDQVTHYPDRNGEGNVKIVIPAGNYVITDVNIFNNFTRRTAGLTFSGAGREVTTIYFNPTDNNQYLFKNDDKILAWHFEDISFVSDRDKNPNFMLSISHGGAQHYTFDRCMFYDWDKIIDMQGTNNNSEFSFYSCAFSGRIKDGVLFVGDVNTSQASDQFLNYDFYACKFEVESGHFINMKYGGNINVYGGSFIHTEFDSEDAVGGTFFRFPHNGHSYGVCRLMVIGARFEHRNRKSLLIDSTWNMGNIEFLNCDMDCYSMVSDSRDWITAKFQGHNTFPSIKFDNCSLLGKHEYNYNTENFQFINSIIYTSCFHSLLTDINNLFAFKTTPEQNFYNFGAAPPIKVENFRGYSNTVYDTTINGTLHAKTMLNKKVFSMKESHGGFPTMGGTIESTLPLGSIITGITLYCPPNAVTSGHDGDFTLVTGEAQPTILATTANDLKPYWEGFDIQQLGFFVCDTEEKRRIILQSGQYIDQTTHKALCLIEYI